MCLFYHDDCQQVDTSAIPVKHTSRVHGPDGWAGPNGLHARFGRDAAHAEWFDGFRLAIKADLGSRITRAWSIVPAAVNEGEVAADLLEAGPPRRDLLADKGFNGKAFTASRAARGTAVLVPPAKAQRKTMPAVLRKVIAEWRNRIETTFKEITDQMELARHGAHTFWGLLPAPPRPSPRIPSCAPASLAWINPHNAPQATILPHIGYPGKRGNSSTSSL
jgi:hypothetical protein